MAQQKSDRPVVPEGGRKAAPTTSAEATPGGKGSAVPKVVRQLELTFTTAENRETRTNGGAERTQATSALCEVPKVDVEEGGVEPATMEEVVKHLSEAMKRVVANQGSAGPDRQSVAQVRARWPEIELRLKQELLEGRYAPGNIRRVYIPKASGGQRGLGIPDVVDRVVQEAIRRVLEPLVEPTFHPSSHGFRPGRSCHTAIQAAKAHVEAGHHVVVDLDLEKFFDRVNHQRLMATLGRVTRDRRLLTALHRMLKAEVVLPDGVLIEVDEGVPQGGPLSPLLSNMVLNELDWELEERGHRFVRYADDCNIYVSSERAGQRVKASVTSFIERRLRLKVNEEKSAVAEPSERHFVGFRLALNAQTEEVDILLSKRSLTRIQTKLKELTPRRWGSSLPANIRATNTYIRGWIGFFGIISPIECRTLASLDAHLRRRLRAIHLHHWKTKLTIAKRLKQLGCRHHTAFQAVYGGRKGIWQLSHNGIIDRRLNKAYFERRGLCSLAKEWEQAHQRLIVATGGIKPAP